MPDEGNTKFMEVIRAEPYAISDETLEPLLEEHPSGSIALAEALIAKELISKNAAGKIWGDSIGIAYVEPVTTIVNRDAMELIPHEIAVKAKVLPLYLFDTLLTIATVDPLNADLIHKLSLIAQHPISAVFSFPSEIEAGIAIHYLTEKTVKESLSELRSIDLRLNDTMSADAISDLTENASLIQVVNSLVYFALRERASDIHIEPNEDFTTIRFRVDGILREVLSFPRKLQVAIVSRLKILCELNITENRFPQDGRFSLAVGTNRADFRVSFMPTIWGEKVVIRVLAFGNKKDFLRLDQMLISQTILQPFKRLIDNPSGIVFVTGPTGSGKTTTLYAALAEINSPGVNITTIEDPVELQVQGINQSQVNSSIDLSFGRILRSILRQDPDVILVGEIRDVETAKIAIEAALTGHLVFATLHTNSAIQAVTRLIDIGVEPYQVAPSVIGVMAQRLAARICQRCKEPYYPSEEALKKYFAEEGLVEVPFYRGRGCPECGYTGYRGRVSFHELALISEEMRTIINRNGSVQELTVAAKSAGYTTLRYDGLKKVLLGLTTIEEIESNSSFEWAC